MRSIISLVLVITVSFSLLLPCHLAATASRHSLLRGASIAVEDHETDFLGSPDGTFRCGFYLVSPTVFTFSVWFAGAKESAVVWTADRLRPVHSKGSRLTLDKHGSALVLTDYDGEPVWNSSWAGARAASRVRLDNSGNLVVEDANGNKLWQSFDSPTDTLLPRQPLRATTRLVSRADGGSDGRLLSSGYYSLGFSDYAMLSLFYDNGNFSSIYWPNPYNNYIDNKRRIYNFSREATMDALGQFFSSDNANFQTADLGAAGMRRRLTLDADGNLRAYSLHATKGTWAVSWMAFGNPCIIHGVCGANAVCLYAPAPSCVCAPGHERADRSDWSKGCLPMFRQHDCATPTKLMELPHTDFWGYDLSDGERTTFDDCAKRCRERCSCVGFQHKEHSNMECYLKSVLFNGRTFPGLPGTVYIKVPADFVVPKIHVHQWQEHVQGQGPLHFLEDNVTGCTTPQGYLLLNVSALSQDHGRDAAAKPVWPYLYGFLSAMFVVEAIVIGLGCCCLFSKKGLFRPSSPVYPMDEGYKLILLTSSFQRYSYAAIKKATANFADVIGRGGSGVVYKGILEDGRVVAVKALTTSISRCHGEEEFEAELSLISRIYHMNLARIVGCCSQGKHRILVSEFIENGSLATMLFPDDNDDHEVLGWSQRFRIAVGVARGLAYLHSECLQWIIHCDMKPENILLDRDLEPKITDFGLAKLLDRRRDGSGSGARTAGLNNSNPSRRIRGTRGYMAPEWVSNLDVSDKVDVYSFGVVLLELVRGVRVADGGENTDVRAVTKAAREKMRSGCVEDLVDERLAGEFSRSQVEVLLGTALSCLEEERSRRPSMGAVVQALISVEDA
ncbi:putative receptor protein kinase ZmPK1 [Lolium perenne]|uniref:putative receptor protein kinase ZmPK1 n=1 Tax=Lolium perenne TaxID=4522 RepID=UPI0021EAC149